MVRCVADRMEDPNAGLIDGQKQRVKIHGGITREWDTEGEHT